MVAAEHAGADDARLAKPSHALNRRLEGEESACAGARRAEPRCAIGAPPTEGLESPPPSPRQEASVPRLFSAYVIVDWSAASKPTTGADSVWIGVLKRDVRFRWPSRASTRRPGPRPRSS